MGAQASDPLLPRAARTPFLCPRLTLFPALAERYEKNGAFAFGMRRKKGRHVVVEEGKAGGAKAESIRGDVEFSAEDSGFELNGAVTTIAEAGENFVEVGQEEDVDCRIARKILLK